LAALLMSITLPTGAVVVGALSFVFVLLLLLAGVMGPMPRYSIASPSDLPRNDSPAFLNVLESLADAKVNRTGVLEVLTDGPCFYPAALEAMRSARHSICLEAYVFHPGEISRIYLEAMTERAKAGVQVNLVLDAFGSWAMTKTSLQALRDAGGRVEWYNKARWYSLARMDNRTHRELLIVDGRIGFIGGAGVADQWWKGKGKNPRWRDTVVRVEGEAVPNLLATFAENWLTSHGELIVGPRYFPEIQCDHRTVAMVVNSTPTPGGSTRARLLLQMLLASAERTISITTPYFLPDSALRRSLVMMARRGVAIDVIVPGRYTDQRWVRLVSRRMWGRLLEAGIRIHEYQPAMLHAKVLIVDDLWSVIGTTNIDNRSFEHNDEVNVAMRDGAVAARLCEDYDRDLEASREVTLDDWRRRPLWEKVVGPFVWILERQQ